MCGAAQGTMVTPAAQVDLQPEMDRLNSQLARLRAELAAMR